MSARKYSPISEEFQVCILKMAKTVTFVDVFICWTIVNKEDNIKRTIRNNCRLMQILEI